MVCNEIPTRKGCGPSQEEGGSVKLHSLFLRSKRRFLCWSVWIPELKATHNGINNEKKATIVIRLLGDMFRCRKSPSFLLPQLVWSDVFIEKNIWVEKESPTIHLKYWSCKAVSEQRHQSPQPLKPSQHDRPWDKSSLSGFPQPGTPKAALPEQGLGLREGLRA